MGVGRGDGVVGVGRGGGGVGVGRTVWDGVGLGAAAEESFDDAAGTKPCSVRAKKSMNVEMPTRRIVALDRISLTPGRRKPTPLCGPFHPYHLKFGKSPPSVAARPPEIAASPRCLGQGQEYLRTGEKGQVVLPRRRAQADRTI